VSIIAEYFTKTVQKPIKLIIWASNMPQCRQQSCHNGPRQILYLIYVF